MPMGDDFVDELVNGLVYKLPLNATALKGGAAAGHGEDHCFGRSSSRSFTFLELVGFLFLTHHLARVIRNQVPDSLLNFVAGVGLGAFIAAIVWKK